MPTELQIAARLHNASQATGSKTFERNRTSKGLGCAPARTRKHASPWPGARDTETVLRASLKFSGNGIHHNLLTHSIVPNGEPPKRFHALLAVLPGALQPRNSVEASPDETTAVTRWRQIRLRATERNGHNECRQTTQQHGRPRGTRLTRIPEERARLDYEARKPLPASSTVKAAARTKISFVSHKTAILPSEPNFLMTKKRPKSMKKQTNPLVGPAHLRLSKSVNFGQFRSFFGQKRPEKANFAPHQSQNNPWWLQ